jgi:hypothetical protein
MPSVRLVYTYYVFNKCHDTHANTIFSTVVRDALRSSVEGESLAILDGKRSVRAVVVIVVVVVVDVVVVVVVGIVVVAGIALVADDVIASMVQPFAPIVDIASGIECNNERKGRTHACQFEQCSQT